MLYLEADQKMYVDKNEKKQLQMANLKCVDIYCLRISFFSYFVYDPTEYTKL